MFLKRASAILIDVVIAVLWFFLPLALGVFLHENFGVNPPNILPLILFICIPIYFIYLPYKTGQTLGKKVMHIKIITTHGHPISLSQAIFRYLVSITLSSAVFGLGFWWALWDKHGRTWHDILTGTMVKINDKL